MHQALRIATSCDEHRCHELEGDHEGQSWFSLQRWRFHDHVTVWKRLSQDVCFPGRHASVTLTFASKRKSITCIGVHDRSGQRLFSSCIRCCTLIHVVESRINPRRERAKLTVISLTRVAITNNRRYVKNRPFPRSQGPHSPSVAYVGHIDHACEVSANRLPRLVASRCASRCFQPSVPRRQRSLSPPG